ncbi:hypothetical protein L3X38_005557 [Prunus dulcis]|uniref:Uncharacterized protein n=1 Tax=Prunus dulcis TaxID=3755 RepID=A0AAD5F462_PRUDU|nr:hypothetical protein L3X38_005557 [Prunus dulcis]
MSQWQKNLHTCRNHLTDWSKRKFKNNKIEIDSLVDQLNLMQHSWEENTENISRIKTKLNDLWRKEECYWQQRSRIKWLQNGDSRRLSKEGDKTRSRELKGKMATRNNHRREFAGLLRSISKSCLLQVGAEIGIPS